MIGSIVPYQQKSIDNIILKFYWSNRNYIHNDRPELNINYIKFSSTLKGYYPLLGFDFQNLEENKEEGATYTLLIDRYRKKEWKGSNTNFSKTRTAGYKHETLFDAEENNRKSEIEIISDKMLIDFGQSEFFKNLRFPNLTGFNKVRQLNISKVKLAFRIRKTIGAEIEESKYLGFINMLGIKTETSKVIDYALK